MRTELDIQLSVLCKELSSLRFHTPIDPKFETLDHFHRLEDLHKRNKLSGVNLIVTDNPVDKGLAFVCLYVGGKVRTFASCGKDFLTAARLADIFMLRIGHLRFRGPADPSKIKYNNSAQQAQTDWIAETDIQAVVVRIERSLRDAGALYDPAASAKKRPSLDMVVARLESCEAQLRAQTQALTKLAEVIASK